MQYSLMCLTGLVLQSFALLKPVYATIVYCWSREMLCQLPYGSFCMHLCINRMPFFVHSIQLQGEAFQTQMGYLCCHGRAPCSGSQSSLCGLCIAGSACPVGCLGAVTSDWTFGDLLARQESKLPLCCLASLCFHIPRMILGLEAA